MDLEDHHFPLAVGANLANVDVGRVRAWKHKGYLKLGKNDLPPTAPGSTTYITYRRVIQIAIATQLTLAGLHPQHAFLAAAYFTDFSDPLEAPGFSRLPGQTFESGSTGLIAWPGMGVGKVFRFVGEKMETPFFSPESGTQTVSIVLWLNRILADVEKRLELRKTDWQ